MKKLGKLSINVDKIIKNEELVNLRGGDYGYGGGFVIYTCTMGPKVPCRSPSLCAYYTSEDLVEAVDACCIDGKATIDAC